MRLFVALLCFLCVFCVKPEFFLHRPLRGETIIGDSAVEFWLANNWKCPGCTATIFINNMRAADNIDMSSRHHTSIPMTKMMPGRYDIRLELARPDGHPAGVTLSSWFTIANPAPPSLTGGTAVFTQPQPGQMYYVPDEIDFELNYNLPGFAGKVVFLLDGVRWREVEAGASGNEIKFKTLVDGWVPGLPVIPPLAPGLHDVAALFLDARGNVVTQSNIRFVTLDRRGLVPFVCPLFANRDQLAQDFLPGQGDGTWQEARACYAEVLAQFPHLWQPQLYLGRVLLYSGDHQLSQRVLRLALRVVPTSAQTREYLRQAHVAAASADSKRGVQRLPEEERPYLSIVVSFRYDDTNYCQVPKSSCLTRLQVMLNILMHLLHKYQLSSEIVLVEWNPLPNAPPLKQLLSPVLDITVPFRVITVPSHIHKSLPGSRRFDFIEFMAKNVGLRRAKGQFVLTTNQDNCFNDALIRRLAKRQLRHDVFYTSVRRSLLAETAPAGPSVDSEAKARYIDNHEKAWEPMRHLHDYFPTWKTIWRYAACEDGDVDDEPLFGATKFEHLFSYAPGDFILAAREVLWKIRGSHEYADEYRPVDSFMLAALSAHGYGQLTFASPCMFQHFEHHPIKRLHINYTLDDMLPEYEKAIAVGPLANIRPAEIQDPPGWGSGMWHRYNDENWGLAQYELPEYSL